MRLRDLYEDKVAATPKRLKKTLPPTFMMTGLQNSNGYPQYRHGLALAVALAVERGEVEFDQSSMWNQNQTVICYTPQEEEILRLANKLVGATATTVTGKKSQEPDWVNHVSVTSGNRPSMDSE
jgi:hypothetical protein